MKMRRLLPFTSKKDRRKYPIRHDEYGLSLRQRCLRLFDDDLWPNDDCRALNNLNVEIVRGDITTPSEILTGFSGVDLVFHLAQRELRGLLAGKRQG